MYKQTFHFIIRSFFINMFLCSITIAKDNSNWKKKKKQRNAAIKMLKRRDKNII